MDIATLGIKIDSTSANKATNDLGKLDAAAEVTEKSVNDLSAASDRLETNLKGAATAGRTATTGLRGAGVQAKTYGRSMDGAAGSTANVFAQLNDIGMMTASGQSPLMLAMQQGTQLNQVFATMGTRAQIFATLRGAMASMLSPVSLLTLGVIAGGAALAQWGISALRAGEDADELAKRMDEIIEKSGVMSRELRAFGIGVSTDELTLLDNIAAAQERLADAQSRMGNRTNLGAGDSFGVEQAQKALEVANEKLSTYRDQVSTLELIKNAEEAINTVTRQALAARLQDQEAAQNILQDLQQQVAIQSMIVRFGEDSAAVAMLRAQHERVAFQEMLSTLDVSEDLKRQMLLTYDVAQDLSNSDIGAGIRGATDDARALAMELDVSLQTAMKLQALDRNGGRNATEMASLAGQYAQYGAGRTAAENYIQGGLGDITGGIKRNTPTASRRGGGASGISEAQREAERQRNEDLREAENILNGLKSAQDEYNDALDQAKRLYEVGVLPVEAYTAHLANLREELMQSKFDEIGLTDFIDSLSQAIANSESLGDVFVSQIRRMSAELISSGLTSIAESIFSGNGGGFINDIFGGFRASGGPVQSGKGYVVGEKGPEWFAPSQSGTIIPNNAMGGGNVHVTVGVSADNNGNLLPFVEGVTRRGVEMGMAQQNRELPGRVNAINAAGDTRLR